MHRRGLKVCDRTRTSRSSVTVLWASALDYMKLLTYADIIPPRLPPRTASMRVPPVIAQITYISDAVGVQYRTYFDCAVHRSTHVALSNDPAWTVAYHD